LNPTLGIISSQERLRSATSTHHNHAGGRLTG
jgi:hypothetical protein